MSIAHGAAAPGTQLRGKSSGRGLKATAVAVVATGMLAVVLATHWGVGVTPDSVTYIGGARSMLTGDGFSMPGAVPGPITHFPPFYSFLLAGIGQLGFDPLFAARWLAVFVFGANISLVGGVLARLSGMRGLQVDLVALLGMISILASATMLEIHTMAWTEPVFILLGMVGFILLARWLEGAGRGYLLGSAGAVGLAFVTRYAGVAYVGTAILAIVFLSRRRWTERVAWGITFGLLATLPMLVWILRNVALAGTTTNRTLYLHVPSLTLLWEALATFSSWFLLPSWLPTIVRGLLLLAIGVVVTLLYVLPALSARRVNRYAGIRTSPWPSVMWLFMLFIPVYGLTLLFSNSVLRAYTPLEGRILAPLYPPLLVIILYGCRQFLRMAPGRRLVRPLLVGLGVIFIGLSLLRMTAYVRQGSANGLGFNGRSWRESETLAQLDVWPATGTLYSNAPEAIYLHLGKVAAKLPRPVEHATGLPNPDYAAEFASMQQEVDRRNALVVLFALPWRSSPGHGELIRQLNLQLLIQTEDGQIFGAGRAGAARE